MLSRLLFNRLVRNLAIVLGMAQVLVWSWFDVAILGGNGPGLAAGFGLAGSLVVLNALAVPRLRAARRSPGPAGILVRGYMNLGVATLLLGIAVALTWTVFLLLSGLLGAVGGSPDSAFTVFRLASGGLVGLVALSLVWGFSGGQWAIDRTHLRFPIPGLAPELDGLRIVQISDLHIGNGLEGRRLDRMVERTNALEPDVVVITGDIFDFHPAYIDEGARGLSRLRARYGVYAILGNHDHYTGAEAIAEGLARRAPNVTLLRDEMVRLPVDAPLYLAGADDPGRDWASRGVDLPGLDALAAGRSTDGPTLLLVHRPEVFPQAARHGFPLVLSGHTHGGQMALPTPGGRFNLASLVTGYTRGVYHLNGSTLYVNRGMGVGGPPLRINCRREIATVELAASAA